MIGSAGQVHAEYFAQAWFPTILTIRGRPRRRTVKDTATRDQFETQAKCTARQRHLRWTYVLGPVLLQLSLPDMQLASNLLGDWCEFRVPMGVQALGGGR